MIIVMFKNVFMSSIKKMKRSTIPGIELQKVKKTRRAPKLKNKELPPIKPNHKTKGTQTEIHKEDHLEVKDFENLITKGKMINDAIMSRHINIMMEYFNSKEPIMYACPPMLTKTYTPCKWCTGGCRKCNFMNQLVQRQFGVWVQHVGHIKAGHWIAFIINNREKSIKLIDSLPDENVAVETGPEWYWEKVESFLEVAKPGIKYERGIFKTYRQDDKDNTCGIRVLYTVKCIFLSKPQTIERSDMFVRRNIAKDIVSGCLATSV